MNTTVTAVRAGLARGRIECRQSLTNALDLWGYLFPTAGLLVAMVFMRGATVQARTFPWGPWRCRACSA